MELIIGTIVIIAVVIWFIRGSAKVSKMNDDPIQNDIFLILIGISADEFGVDEAYDNLNQIIFGNNFKSSELTSRIAHACSMVKTTGNHAIYERSKRVCDVVIKEWPNPVSASSLREILS
ncbi:hypothetical protein FY036_06520 [Mesorhizobium microcysteis]|uniref:Uncharacterized protein n=1 Tax=Neoaquamicrobium microcysteis TaxID=2682781 RepID=A0A5D4GYP5_9HYPH|nr:hypothetical protein [Mesorhizobium microcysteis]TYR33706.1 hypothetical protein FY036_06520 [Mesorhizobium microcysteis]